MKTRFRNAILAGCKDFGLSDKAIDDLVATGVNMATEVNGLGDDASEEDIQRVVDSILPFARAMQAEVTRKTQKKTIRKPLDDGKGDDKGGDGDDGGLHKLVEQMRDELSSFRKENEQMKAERNAAERKAAVKAKAKDLGIPDEFVSRFAIGDDEDIETALTDFKQSLVNASLMPKDLAREAGGEFRLEQAEQDEEAFVKSLPDM